jgi:hypothetical protein
MVIHRSSMTISVRAQVADRERCGKQVDQGSSASPDGSGIGVPIGAGVSKSGDPSSRHLIGCIRGLRVWPQPSLAEEFAW